MPEVLIVTAYLAVAAAAWLRIYAWLYRSHRREFPILTWNTGDRMFATLWGGMVAILWPLSGSTFAAAWLVREAARRGPLSRAFDALERQIATPTHHPSASRNDETTEERA